MRVTLNNGRATLPTRRNVMTTRYEQDLDTQLSEMFAIHKEYFDRREREAEGRPDWHKPKQGWRPVNRERLIGLLVEGDE